MYKRPTCEILKQSIEVFSALFRRFPRCLRAASLSKSPEGSEEGGIQ